MGVCGFSWRYGFLIHDRDGILLLKAEMRPKALRWRKKRLFGIISRRCRRRHRMESSNECIQIVQESEVKSFGSLRSLYLRHRERKVKSRGELSPIERMIATT